ncbi:hypothetical protein WR25_19523 [Diploscapter pachys]|uniref:Fatty-acid and retinol-binding protein 1 n=1 Tax=Diploscapter pachys TaxID=2018661 RepID=A0A2A2LQU3_9BILA|nr:hypothetical protein WR25_19523 [Diploscapter pachys]
MLCRVVVSFALFAAAFSLPLEGAPEKFEDIPAEYKTMIPEEVATHLKSITPEEKAVLKELAKNYKDYKDENDFLEAIKAKSPSLYEKSKKLHDFIKAKVDKLGKDAKEFVTKVLADGRKLHADFLAGNKPSLDDLKTIAKKHLDAFNNLSEESKKEFEQEFPITTSVFKNDKIKALIDKYVQN